MISSIYLAIAAFIILILTVSFYFLADIEDEDEQEWDDINYIYDYQHYDAFNEEY